MESRKLQNIVKNLYKHTGKPNQAGYGTTADAIRSERATLWKSGGTDHRQKGQESMNGLNNWLRMNQNAPYHDQLVARSLLQELQSVLGGIR